MIGGRILLSWLIVWVEKVCGGTAEVWLWEVVGIGWVSSFAVWDW